MFETIQKTFMNATLGALATAGLASTASAHTLVVDFKGGEGGSVICADSLEFCTAEFRRLIDTIAVREAGGDEGKIWYDKKFDKKAAIEEFLRNLASRYDGSGLTFKIDAGSDKCVIVLKNGTVTPKEFEHLLKNVNFPFEIVFEKVGGKFGLPSDGFAKHVTSIGFIRCGDLELTEEFFEGMREYDKLGCIKFAKGLYLPRVSEGFNWEDKNGIIELKPQQVNVAPEPQEFKTIKDDRDEPKLPAPGTKEAPKESDLSAKATNPIGINRTALNQTKRSLVALSVILEEILLNMQREVDLAHGMPTWAYKDLLMKLSRK